MAPISPISAFGSIGSIEPLTGVTGAGGTTGIADRAGKSGTAGVAGFDFSDALSKVQGSLDNADELSRQLATGQLTDVHDFTVAANKAQLSVQLTVALRNQALSAFQEIMRMQI